jgi:hypothetical protein
MAANRFPWFCLWHESRVDKKLETLDDDEFRVWHRLLCYASEQPERGIIADLDPFLLAIEVARGDEELLMRTIGRLVKLRIVDDADPDRLGFINFNRRNDIQPSDLPPATSKRKADQRRRERELLAVAEPDVTPGVTPPAQAACDTTSDVTVASRDVTPGHALTEQDRRGEEKTAQKRTPGGDDGQVAGAAPGVATPASPDTDSGSSFSPVRSFDAGRKRRARAVALFNEVFWPAWPHKISKHEAQVAFVKRDPTEAEVALMVAAIPAQSEAFDWPRERWRFCPHPATWLNGRRWEDEIPPPGAAPARASPNGRSANGDNVAEAKRLLREGRGPGPPSGTVVEASYTERRH